MPTKVLPILGSEGWATDPDTVMSKLFSHAFLTDWSESNVFQGSVVSIQYLLSQHQSDLITLADSIENTMRLYFSRYFTDVQCDFQLAPTQGSSARLVFNFYVTGIKDGKSIELRRALLLDGSKSNKLFFKVLENNEVVI